MAKFDEETSPETPAKQALSSLGDSELVSFRVAAKRLADGLRMENAGGCSAAQPPRIVALGILEGMELGVLTRGTENLSHCLEKMYQAVQSEGDPRANYRYLKSIGDLLLRVNATGLAVEGASLADLAIPKKVFSIGFSTNTRTID